ncbi:DUF6178 family protein [Thermodesulfobacteriota bacterium]
MPHDQQHKMEIERAKNLLKQRKAILSLPPEEALDRILDAKHPAALVQSFSEEDFYFLIHDIGPEDAVPLLPLASLRQWEYLVDMEVWRRDRVHIKSITRWLDLLLHSDPGRLAKWLVDEQPDFFEFYLFKNIEVVEREHDQDPGDLGKGFITFDDVHYFRFITNPFDPEMDVKDAEDRNEVLLKLLGHIAEMDHIKFQQLLLESAAVIPAESEEEIYRMRNVRLAEKGFLPFDEAVGVYQPLSARDLEHQGKKYFVNDGRQTQYLPAPLYPSGMLSADNPFTDALSVIDSEEILQQLQTEFAGLANQIIAADQKPMQSKEALTGVVKKACGYLSIGLRELSKKKQKADAGRNAALIQAHPLSRIFRVGYGLALKLKWRAERWRTRCWFVEKKLPLRFWDEHWMGVLGGLFVKTPLFFDNYITGDLYREFISFEDIEKTEDALNDVIAFDDLLSLIPVDIDSISSGVFLTYKNLILTLWAGYYLGLPDAFGCLKVDQFIRFFDDLWVESQKPRRIKRSMKESFLKWICEKTDLDPSEVSDRVGKTLEAIFEEMESELGSVAPKDLDTRYIHLFLLEI